MLPPAGETTRGRRRTPPRRGGSRIRWAALVFGGFVGVLAILCAVLLVMLRQGPINAAFLRAPIAAAIERDAAPLRAEIGAASFDYVEEAGGLGLTLTSIAFRNADGTEAGSIARARIDVDWAGLLTGSLAPRSITLIEPRLRMSYSDTGGLQLTALPLETGQEPGEESAWQTVTTKTTPRASGQASPAAEAPPSANVIASLRSLLASPSRDGKLTTLRIRSGLLDIAGPERSTPWRVPAFDLSLDNREGRAILVGSGTAHGPNGRTHGTLSAEQASGGTDVKLTLALDQIVPADVADLSPALRPLAAVLLPIGGEARLDFGADNQLARLDMKLGLGTGLLDVGGACADSFRLDRGGAHITYVRGSGRIELLPSELRNQGSGAVVAGLATVARGPDGHDRWAWRMNFADAKVADLANGLAPLPIGNWTARGSYSPATGEAVLDRMSLETGPARLAMAGRIGPDGALIEARVADAQAALMLRLWPVCFQSYARNWVLENVRSGTISKGHMRMALDTRELERLGDTGKVPDEAATAEFDVRDINFTYAPGLPAVTAANGSMQFAGRRFTAQVPEAVSKMPSGQELKLTNARYEVPDFLDPSPRGRIALDTSGAIEAGLEYLDLKPLGFVKASGLAYADLLGEFKSSATLELPVTRPMRPGELKLTARSNLKNARLRKPVNGFSLDGGSIDIDATDSSLEVTGDVLVNSVPAKLTWNRVLGEGAPPAPPLQISAVLADNDREQLGIFVNHMISGPMPVTMQLAAKAGESGRLGHVTADLGDTEIVIDTLAFRKPPGEAAAVAFDIVRSEKGGTRLDDLRLTGDKIALKGTINLGTDNKLTAFDFPEFSVNLVTRLNVTGRIRPDGVLDVKARGSYFDGRDFFKSLFSLGQLTATPLPPPKATTGLDLTADIDTVLGHSQVSLRNLRIVASRRKGDLSKLEALADFDGGGGSVGVKLRAETGKPRILQAEADDAGRAFKLIGLYQSLEGGTASIQVNLDAEGAAETSGTLWARQFVLLGDPVVKEVLSGVKPAPGTESSGQGERQRFDFERMRVAFSVGAGQLVLHDALINGPIIGATLRGRIDYGAQRVQIGGTYIPLFGLNSVFGALPILGPLLGGRNGEGLFGITFLVEGPLAGPEVIVNPVSAVAPGVFRQIFEMGPGNPSIQPRDGRWQSCPQGQGEQFGTADSGRRRPERRRRPAPAHGRRSPDDPAAEKEEERALEAEIGTRLFKV